MAPEHRRLARYSTMTLDQIMALAIEQIVAPTAHLYLWCPNALLAEGLAVMAAWGITYKSNIVWHKIRKDGGSDGRGVGFYFRNVTELILFGVRGKNARTLAPGRRQVNYIASCKREHSRKPGELYPIIEACSPGPYFGMFARGAVRKGWVTWGDQADDDYHRRTGEVFKMKLYLIRTVLNSFLEHRCVSVTWYRGDRAEPLGPYEEMVQGYATMNAEFDQGEARDQLDEMMTEEEADAALTWLRSRGAHTASSRTSRLYGRAVRTERPGYLFPRCPSAAPWTSSSPIGRPIQVVRLLRSAGCCVGPVR